MKKIIALVGGMGNMGSLIVKELLKDQNVQIRMLVQPEKMKDIDGLLSSGIEVIEGSLGQNKTEILNLLCKDAYTVISAVQGGPDVIIDGQAQLLQCANDAGVTRFIPADYVANIFSIKEGQNIPLDWRRQFANVAEKIRGNVEVVHVLNGGLLDKAVIFGEQGIINEKTLTASFWGDGNMPMDWTTYADVAKYVAQIAVDEKPVAPVFSIAGTVLSFHEMVKEFEETTGKKLNVVNLGSLTDLNNRIAELQEGGDRNFPLYFPLVCLRSMFDGEGKLQELMNDRYPSVKTITLGEYVRTLDL